MMWVFFPFQLGKTAERNATVKLSNWYTGKETDSSSQKKQSYPKS